MKKLLHPLVFTLLLFTLSCTNPPKETEPQTAPQPAPEAKKVTAPEFNSDSAYAFLKKQVDFGPRVPGTKAHSKCADYFQKKLSSYGLKVNLQQAPITTFDNNTFTLKNIFASYRPELKNRILLTAHWDSRPFADNDIQNIGLPIDGANDGASGAAVLLEISRLLALH